MGHAHALHPALFVHQDRPVRSGVVSRLYAHVAVAVARSLVPHDPRGPPVQCRRERRVLEQHQLISDGRRLAGEWQVIVGPRRFDEGLEKRQPDVVVPAGNARLTLAAIPEADIHDGGPSERFRGGEDLSALADDNARPDGVIGAGEPDDRVFHMDRSGSGSGSERWRRSWRGGGSWPWSWRRGGVCHGRGRRYEEWGGNRYRGGRRGGHGGGRGGRCWS